MDKNIAVVINTFNEENNIERAIKSVKWASEIVVCDMHSNDQTVQIAKELGAKVIFHKNVGYVEPARNYAISKTSHDWIMLLDADEEVPKGLAERLRKIVDKYKAINYVEIPRKNIIFGKWMQNSGWWPDYQIRLFKKGALFWQEKIHSKPKLEGAGIRLDPNEDLAIVHHNYQSLEQFIERMNRYTKVEAAQLTKEGYKFDWKDLLRKPLDEFLSRYFANKGYQDGLHGLALSLLQTLSLLIVYLKVWELSGFKEGTIEIAEINEERKRAGNALNYWAKQAKSANSLRDFFKKLIH